MEHLNSSLSALHMGEDENDVENVSFSQNIIQSASKNYDGMRKDIPFEKVSKKPIHKFCFTFIRFLGVSDNFSSSFHAY